MPLPLGLYYVDIEKAYQNEFWTNRYVIAASSPSAGAATADSLVAVERTLHYTPILITRYRISDDVPLTDNYFIKTVNLAGQSVVAGDLLPLFNVLRCDFNVVSGGRPSRKYFRGCLLEADITFNDLVAGALTNRQNQCNQFITIQNFLDVDGQTFASASVSPKVGMRQLRRGSKRKAPTAGPT